MRVGGWIGGRYCVAYCTGFLYVAQLIVLFTLILCLGGGFKIALLEVSWAEMLCICVSVYLVAVGYGLVGLWWILSVGVDVW